MHRRDALRLTGNALLLTALPVWSLRGKGTLSPTGIPRLFFESEEVPRIRANTQTDLLGPLFQEWLNADVEEGRAIIGKPAETGDLLRDLAAALMRMFQESTVYLITEDPARKELLEHGIRTLIALPKWDYFLEGGTEVVGIMRASLAVTSLLFAREVLDGELDPDLEAALMQDIGDKGCAPCNLTIWGMDHPDQVKGWSFDEQHSYIYDLSLERWPEILGANNLRAIPTMGLGLGALALEGRDDRAAEWLDRAVASAQTYLRTFSPDGSYFEGLSYVDYAFSSMLPFLEAHYRRHGTVDWIDKANFYGITEFITCMQAGRTPDGMTADIVNFSDSRMTVRPMVTAWMARRGGDSLAQYATEHFSEPSYYGDFLWYDPDLTATPPPEHLKNKRLDLDWIIARTGWEPDDSVLAFRSGLPANHEHADRNSFFFKAYGERLLTDPFGAAYDWRDEGWLLRLPEAHNAVLVDGKGHQYHNGEEGTNEGKAEAYVRRYVDRGEVVWWCSEATQGYHLVNPDIARVQRSVLFAKPDVVIVFDQVEKTAQASTVAVRFHPDNRDGQAAINVQSDGHFLIQRPNAILFGWTMAQESLALSENALALPEESGHFPFVEVVSPSGLQHEVVTVLVARRAAEEVPDVAIASTEQGWGISVDGKRAFIQRGGDVPELAWDV
jgi:hypothetical protein